jgi:predicted MFS family arabinose efflux permease
LNAAPGLGALIGSLLTGHVARVRRVGRAVTVCVVGWGLAITGFGLVRWLPAALLLLVLAGAADVVSSVFRMIIVQQSAPDAMQGRVNSLVFAGLQGGPRLGDAEAGVVADLAGPQIAAWSGGLLSVACAIVTCWAIPQFWRYQSTIRPTGAPARGSADRAGSAGEAKLEPGLASGPGQPAGDAGAGGQGPGGPGLTRQS